MNEIPLIQKIAAAVIPVLFAITVHEVAHGWVAYRLGDPTARMLGRLTLNPLKHIDPIGTILVPGLLLLSFNGLIFGWAKPVPITWENLKNPRRDVALVAVAGPLSNLLMAILWAAVTKLYLLVMGNIPPAALFMFQLGILINLVLMILNLLPIPPLDGSKVLMSFLPVYYHLALLRIEPYGFVLLIALMLLGWLQKIIAPPIFGLYGWILTLFNL